MKNILGGCGDIFKARHFMEKHILWGASFDDGEYRMLVDSIDQISNQLVFAYTYFMFL